MFRQNWLTLLPLSFVLVSLINSLLASCTAIFYQNTPTGRLSHGQLRIKQGTATLEQRLNVFCQTFLFSFITLRVYLVTVPIWLTFSAVE